jgi:hypothetical protein
MTGGGEVTIELGTGLTLLALSFGAWAWVVAHGVQFMRRGIHEMRDSVLSDLKATKDHMSREIGELEKHMFKELTDVRVHLTKTSEAQNVHINQTERRLTMLETEFQFVKAQMFIPARKRQLPEDE